MDYKKGPKKLFVSLPDKFLQEIDAYAESDGRTRSELVREAFRYYLQVYHSGETTQPV